MALSESDRNLAAIAAAGRLDRLLDALVDLAPGGAALNLGLLVNGMTVYGQTVSPRAFYERIDEAIAQMAARTRESEPDSWSEEAAEQLKDMWVQAYDDDRRKDRELIERNASLDLDAMSDDDARAAIRRRATTLTLAAATVCPPAGAPFKVPLLRLRLSEIAGWWLLPSNPDGSASIAHPTIG